MSQREQIAMAWQACAFFIGAALPLKMFGPAVMFAWLFLALVFGLIAMGRQMLSLDLWRETVTSTGFKAGLGVLLALALASALGIDPSYSGKRLTDMALVGFLALPFYVILRTMPAQNLTTALSTLAWFTLGISALTIIDALANSHRLSFAIHGKRWESAYRLNEVSSLLAVLLPWAWAWLIKRHREGDWWVKWYGLPLAVMGFVALLIAGGRAGWVGGFAALAVFMVLAGRWHGLVLHTRHWLAMPFVLVAGVVGYGLAAGWELVINRLKFWNEPYQGGPLSGRLDIWKMAWGHMFDHPFTGIGLSAFRKLPVPADPFPSNAHPHNWALEVALETGLVGSVLIAVLLFVLARYLWRHAQVNLYALAGGCGLVGFFVSGLANFSLFQAWWTTFFVITALLAVRVCRTERRYD